MTKSRAVGCTSTKIPRSPTTGNTTTSEATGKGNTGDDVIWTLVRWPSLRPIDSFKIAGGVGMIAGIHESQAKLEGRWRISHDPDRPGIGPVPARGFRSKFLRAAVKALQFLESI